MVQISQNKKIAISAFAVFVVSFSVMLFILKHSGQDFEHGAANILAASHSAEENDHSDYSKLEDVKSYINENEISFILNLQGDIYESSKKFCELLEMDCQDIKGSSVFDVIHTSDVKTFAADNAKIITSKEKFEGLGPYRLSSENGEAMVLLNTKPLMQNNQIEYISVQVEDLTAKIEEFKKEKEEKLELKDTMQNIVKKISFNN
ncbi:hypothetical protein COU74_01250 [Candidatus Peregrinibacteria bacterium CG10_big_fil_rev_8_21_14_0_10_36_19]|nr:MAG: hypothetical protein COU74_01250 [Candidatus Peregrinibacteria bacterium CG10_big_fil_rev_8_21_14_0_10_36_19]